jgi:TPR repeat protein
MVLYINSCHADYSAGLCYHYGTGEAQDEQEPVRYFKLAADQGDAKAQYSSGESWHTGDYS